VERRAVGFALNLARPLLDEGALVALRIGDPIRIEPVGLLQPKSGMAPAAMRLAEFLGRNR
jgi:hypothetical protein